MSGQFTACDLHFPHKEWSDDPLERANYLAVEWWAYRFRTGCPQAQSEGTLVSIGQSSACDLHIPHKEWAQDERERQNYLEMERWANYFRLHCCAGGAGAGGMPPESPPVVIDNVVSAGGVDYCEFPGSPPDALEDDIRFNRVPSLVQTGITYDTPIGPGGTVQPYGYTSSYSGDIIHWFMPPTRNLHIHLKFNFSETVIPSPYDVEPVTRQLHIKLTRTSDGLNINDFYQAYTGTRIGPIVGELDVGPFDMPDAFTIHSYCLWNSVHSRAVGTHNGNVYSGGDGLVVTGII